MNKLELEFLVENNAIEAVYDAKSLLNAAKAWEYGRRIRTRLGVSSILNIHYLLMNELRPDIAGKIRDCAVMVGSHYCPPELPFALMQKMSNWIDLYYNGVSTYQDAHVAFEKLHPFEDGNGRVGRILYNLQRLNRGAAVHVIHEGAEQQEYYGWFK